MIEPALPRLPFDWYYDVLGEDCFEYRHTYETKQRRDWRMFCEGFAGKTIVRFNQLFEVIDREKNGLRFHTEYDKIWNEQVPF